MTKTFCNKCGEEIIITLPMKPITVIYAEGEAEFCHYCHDCYPKVRAGLIPVLGKGNNTTVVNYGIPDNTHVVAGGKDGKD